MIILQNMGPAWLPVWHYAVVIGYDATREILILRSGTTARKIMNFGVFEKTWARSDYWGILILQPTRLPAVAEEKKYLAAVLGLEKAGQYRAAAAGYRTALTRWPTSLVAHMGLGNSYYALRELQNAERVFKKTMRLHPDAGSAYNNLAQVLMEQGRYPEALARIDALSDDEVIRIADHVKQLPAGGGAIEFILIVSLVAFLVLVILDIAGVTDIFPFIKAQR